MAPLLSTKRPIKAPVLGGAPSLQQWTNRSDVHIKNIVAKEGLDKGHLISYIYRMKGKIKMKKTKTDPVKDFQKQAVDQRVCLFYVADRVKGILEDSKTNAQLRDQLEEFKDECVHNIGTNALIERYEY